MHWFCERCGKEYKREDHFRNHTEKCNVSTSFIAEETIVVEQVNEIPSFITEQAMFIQEANMSSFVEEDMTILQGMSFVEEGKFSQEEITCTSSQISEEIDENEQHNENNEKDVHTIHGSNVGDDNVTHFSSSSVQVRVKSRKTLFLENFLSCVTDKDERHKLMHCAKNISPEMSPPMQQVQSKA